MTISTCKACAFKLRGEEFCPECGIETIDSRQGSSDCEHTFLDAGCVAKVVDSAGNGQPFTVVFKKKDGSLRVMSCLRDRDKAVILPQTSALDGQVKVWDRKKEAPRTFNLDKVVRISIP